MKGAWKNMKEYTVVRNHSVAHVVEISSKTKGPWKNMSEYTLISDHSDVPHVIKDSNFLTIITKYM